MNLTHRLFLLVAIALLPAIAIQGYNEFDLRRSRESGFLRSLRDHCFVIVMLRS